MVEQRTHKPLVAGSIPASGTNLTNRREGAGNRPRAAERKVFCARPPSFQHRGMSVPSPDCSRRDFLKTTAGAVAAYRAFLKLAPSDPLAPQVRAVLKQIAPAKK